MIGIARLRAVFSKIYLLKTFEPLITFYTQKIAALLVDDAADGAIPYIEQ